MTKGYYTVDASVLVKLVVDEEYSHYALKLVSDPSVIMHAPEIIHYEVGSVLYKMARRGILDKGYSADAYKSLLKLSVELFDCDQNALSDILEMSHRLQLHFYDCCYIYTAKKTRSVLVSSDQKLLDASAKEECECANLGTI